jgi:pimeloyl-ACP methyl ester carboxylesterase
MQQTMAAWRSLVRRMAGTGYRIVLFDFPNQGRAVTTNGDASASLRQQVEVLHAIAAHVSPVAPVALIGGSWGALVAAGYAATHPERVARLVLGSFQTRPSAKLRDVARRGRAFIEQGRLDDLATLFVSEFGDRMSEARQSAIRTQFRALRPAQLRQMYDQGLLLLGGDDLSLMFDLSRISARTLIVNGEADPLLDPYDAVLLVRRLHAARIHVEPEAGHFLHFERPRILDTYAQFLN